MVAWRGPILQKIFSCCVAVSCLFVGAIMAWSVLDAAIKVLPVVYDPVLYRVDFLLGFLPLYRLADFLDAHPALYGAVLVFYKYNLLFAVPVIFAEAFVTCRMSAGLTLQLLISSFLVFPLFCLLPALAPAFFFGSLYPHHLPAMMSLPPRAVLAPVDSIRNTFPSLHAVWAILLFLSVMDGPVWLLATVFAYLLITFLATIGFGEHYVVDWVGALPLVLFVRGLCASGVEWATTARGAPIVAGLLLLAAWVVLVRTAPGSLAVPGLTGGLALLCVAVPVGLERKLFQAERARA